MLKHPQKYSKHTKSNISARAFQYTKKIQKQTIFFAHQESEKLDHFCPKPVQLGERHGVS